MATPVELLEQAKAFNSRVKNLIAENKSLKAENKLLRAQIQAQTDRAEFVEDCIAEMAEIVYA